MSAQKRSTADPPAVSGPRGKLDHHRRLEYEALIDRHVRMMRVTSSGAQQLDAVRRRAGRLPAETQRLRIEGWRLRGRRASRPGE